MEFDRRQLLTRGAGAVGAVGAASMLGLPSTAQAATRFRGIDGSWLVHVNGLLPDDTPPFLALWSFAEGGVLVASDQRETGQGGEGGKQTSGQGVWASDRRLSFTGKYLKFGSTPDGLHFAVIIRRFSGTMNPDMSTFEASGELEVDRAIGGVLFKQGFTAHGERIVLP